MNKISPNPDSIRAAATFYHRVLPSSARLRRVPSKLKHVVRPLVHYLRMKVKVASRYRYDLWRVYRRVRAFPFGRSRKPIFLFLAPEAGLQPFYASHALLARVMKDAGHPILLLSCNGI